MMHFEPIRYMQWYKTRPHTRYSLARSGVEPRTLDQVDLAWEDLELSGTDYYGYPPLLEQIAARYGVDPQNIVSTLGTSGALFLICAALLSEGDRVVVETPVYETVTALPQACGAEIALIERRFENGWQIDPEEFAAAVTPGTKMVLLTNLHNPTGAQLPEERLAEFAAFCADRGAWLVIDEVYREFPDELIGTTSFGIAPSVITCSSLCKVWGLGDLRCGWILAPDELIGLLRAAVDHVFVEHAFVAERIAAALFGRLDALRAERREQTARNRALVTAFIESRPELSWVPPADGVVAFPRLADGLSADELTQRLARDHDTELTPGSHFAAPRHLRLGFGGPTEELEIALGYVGRALDDLKG